MRNADKVIYILRMYIKLNSEKLGKYDKFVDEIKVEKIHEIDDEYIYKCYLTCSLFSAIIFTATFYKENYIWSISPFMASHTDVITEVFADELIREESYRIEG